jgi:hypothetical protein
MRLIIYVDVCRPSRDTKILSIKAATSDELPVLTVGLLIRSFQLLNEPNGLTIDD